MRTEAARRLFHGYDRGQSCPKAGWLDAEFPHGMPHPGEELLPDAITQIGAFGFLSRGERIFVARIQARTYANLFGAVQTFLLDELPGSGAGSRALAAVATRCATDEASFRAMRFRYMEDLLARGMPSGYRCVPGFHKIVRSASGWAREAQMLAVALFEESHRPASGAAEEALSPAIRDALRKGRCDGGMHATVAEMALIARHNRMDEDARDANAESFVDLIRAVDRGLRAQAQADARYFAMYSVRAFDRATADAVAAAFLKAYRWQHLLAGMRHPRFVEVMQALLTEAQRARLDRALAALG